MDSAVNKELYTVFNAEIDWLGRIIQRRFDLFYDRTYTPFTINEDGKKLYDYSKALLFDKIDTVLPNVLPNQLPYCDFINTYNIPFEERLLLVLSLVSHLKPDFLLKEFKEEMKHNQIGLVRGQNFKGFLPSGLTFLFLLCGEDLEKRMKSQYLLSSGILIKEKVIHLESALSGDPFFNGKLIFSKAYFNLFCSVNNKETAIEYENKTTN